MAFEALIKLKKNGPRALTTAGIISTDNVIPVDHCEYFSDDDGNLITEGIRLGPNDATVTKTEEITITGRSATSGPGNLTGVVRGVNADGTNGAANDWDSGTQISVGITSKVYEKVRTNFAAHQTLIVAQRTRLTANTTYYVATTGNDTTGTGAVGTPWATIQHAYDYICSYLDLSGYTITIQMADGTYSGGLAITQPWTGGGSITIQGNTGNMDSVIISASNGIVNQCVLPGVLTIQYIKFTGDGSAIYNTNVGQIIFNHLNIASQYCGFYAQGSGAVISGVSATYTISSSATNHVYARMGGRVDLYGTTVTVSGTPAFSGEFIHMESNSYTRFQSSSYTGSATGKRYSILTNAVCDSGGVTLPGGVAGTTDGFGVYT